MPYILDGFAGGRASLVSGVDACSPCFMGQGATSAILPPGESKGAVVAPAGLTLYNLYGFCFILLLQASNKKIYCILQFQAKQDH